MSEGYSGADEEPVYRPAPAPKKMKAEAPSQGATMLDALFGGPTGQGAVPRHGAGGAPFPLRGRK